MNYQHIKLANILNRSTSMETPLVGKTYMQAGVQLWGKGLYFREQINGENTAYSNFIKLSEGDLIFNKIWARNGATTVVEKQFDGLYVSTEFVVFHLNTRILEPKWMQIITRLKWFWEACNDSSFGTSGKNRIKPEKFLEIVIPIPTLAEQYQIIAKLESIETKISQIRKIRAEQEKEIYQLLYSKYLDVIRDARWLPMSEVAPIIRREVKINEDSMYPELGIRSFGKGTFHKPTLSAIELGTKRIYQIKTGDLIFSNVFAWEGAIAVAKNEDNDRYGSHRFISCLVNYNLATAEFLCFHFLTQKGLEDINMASPGGAGRNKTLGLEKLMKIQVPVPELELQEEFVSLICKVNETKNHIKVIKNELNELLISTIDNKMKTGRML